MLTFLLFFLSYARPTLQISAELPESIHRQSWLTFARERFMQRMLLEATLKHRSPITHACSSLEGSSSLYGSRVQPAAARELLGDDIGEAVTEAAQRRVKLIMLQPDGGTDIKLAIKEYLSKMQERGSEADSGVDTSGGDDALEPGGQVIYEGTSEGLADLEGLAQQMLRASGLPQSAAGALETQLARAITNVEFDKEELKDALPAGNSDRSASNRAAAQSTVDRAGSTDPSGAHTVRRDAPSSLTPEQIEGMSREQLASSYKSLVEAMRISQEGQPPSDPPPIAGHSERRVRDVHQRQQEPPYVPYVEKTAPKQREPLHPSAPKQRSRGSSGSDKSSHKEEAAPEDNATVPNRIYVDSEGRQFLLDGVQPNSGDQVWYDSETGNTYTADDGQGTSGQLTRRLGENRVWLDGLNDAEYDAYWDSYHDDLDKEAQTDLDSEHPSGHKPVNVQRRQRRT